MCQIHTQWSHFSRQLVTVVVDDILIEKVWSDHHVMINNSTLHLLSHCLSGGPRLKKNLNSNSIFFVIVLVSYFQKGRFLNHLVCVISLKVKALGRGCKKCLLFFAGLQATQQWLESGGVLACSDVSDLSEAWKKKLISPQRGLPHSQGACWCRVQHHFR